MMISITVSIEIVVQTEHRYNSSLAALEEEYWLSYFPRLTSRFVHPSFYELAVNYDLK